MHYPVPLHLQRALAPLGYSPGAFPAAEGWAQEGLSLPMFPGLDRERVQIVAERIAAGLSR
jgi:dTDP-4-amino-4,6-dideoxygalactose transaminase